MGVWSGAFPEATWSGTDWGLGNFSDGYNATTGAVLSPPDILAGLAVGYFQADGILSELFDATRIRKLDFAPVPQDSSTWPRLYVYPGNLEDRESPGKGIEQVAHIYATVGFLATHIGTVGNGQATVASVMHRLKQVLRANCEFKVQIQGASSETALVENLFFGPHSTAELVDDAGRPWGFLQTLEAICEVHLSPTTGRFQQIERAGG